MSPPIYTPDGTEVSEIVLPDGSTASQVIGPDGNVVFEAGPDIPDSRVTRYSCENANTDTSIIADVWGSNDATNVNGVSYNSLGGPSGNGEYQYDRSSQDQYSSTSIQNYNDSFTFALLANHTDVDNVDLVGDLSGELSGIQITYRTDDLQFNVLKEGNNETIQTNINTSGSYRWFILTHDEDNDESYGYINKNQYGPVTQAQKPNPDTDIKIAKRGSRSTNHPTMDMADFRYYNKSISQSEVNNLVDTGRI